MKLLSTTDGDYCKVPQLAIISVPNPTWQLYNATSTPKTQEALGKRR